MNPIILVAETGSDLTPELASRYHIRLAPMHVSFDTETLDDGSFPVQKICDYYHDTGKLPRTSGCSPEDFIRVFDEIHAEYPDSQILYLAYSSITTCSYQSALIAAEDRDYITAIDTRQVSIGQAAVVTEVAKLLEEHPEMTIQEAADAANTLIERARMCFLPDNLEFLRAGGRVSNVVCLGSRILNIHPCIEILDGKLVATRKYRGKMKKVITKLIKQRCLIILMIIKQRRFFVLAISLFYFRIYADNSIIIAHTIVSPDISGLHLAHSTLALGHLSFLCLNHFFHHISTNRTILFGGQVSVVSIRQRHTQFTCHFKFETV